MPLRTLSPDAAGDASRETSHENRGTQAGLHVGRYIVLSTLGSGAMGIVLEAYDPELDRKVALKLLRSSRARRRRAQTRLRREAQALAQLNHPNVVTVFEVGVYRHRVFVAMEFIRGQTLREWLDAAPERPWAEVVSVFADAGRGLAAAHEVGLIHRDFKLDNVMIGQDGRVRVMDFGLVRRDNQPSSAESPPETDTPSSEEEPPLDDEIESPASKPALSRSPSSFDVELTNSGTQLGTPAYMSPEQLRGWTVDARSDQFSFCVALYEALFRRRPFPGKTIAQIQAAVLGGRMRPLPRDTKVPAWLAALVLRGLSLDPDGRHPSMAALLDALTPDPWISRRTLVGGLGVLFALVVSLALSLGLRLGEGELIERLRVAELQREITAVIELEGMKAQIQDADLGAAQALVDEFVTYPAHAGTAAQARAWRLHGQRLLAHGEHERGLDTLAAAYVSSSDHDRQLVLLELARHFAKTQDWHRLGATLATIESSPDGPLGPYLAEFEGLQALESLSRRDFSEALATLDPQTDPRLVAALQALAPTTITSYKVGVMGLRPLPLPDLDLDGDGIGELPVFRPGQPQLDLLGTASPQLEVIASAPLTAIPDQLSTVSGGPTNLVVNHSGSKVAALRLDARGPGFELTQLFERDIASRHTAKWTRADLDDDGAVELYVSLATKRQTLVAEAGPLGWEFAPIGAGTVMGSVVNDVLAVDLDGDGRQELAVSAAEWTAYDLRVLGPRSEPSPDPSATLPALELLARIKLGTTGAIVALPKPDGVGHWLVVAVSRDYPSRAMFPVEQLHGSPGLHVLEWVAGSFREIAAFDLPPAQRMYAGDFDGDGLCDLALGTSNGDELQTELIVQVAPGEFDAVSLRGLWPLGVANLDDDSADELLVAGFEATAEDPSAPGPLMILGRGHRSLPTLEPKLQLTPPSTGPSSLADADGRVARARQLVSLGLPLRAAAELAALADIAAPRPGAWLRLEAAALLDHQGHQLAAAEAYERASEDPTLLDGEALPSRLLAAELYAEVHRFDDAARLTALALLLASPDERPALEAQRDQWRALVVDPPRLAFDFDEPLDDRWVLDPLAIRHRGAALALTLGGTERGVVARRELEWVGERLSIDMELELEILDAMSEVNVELRSLEDPERPLLLSVGVSVNGGGGINQRRTRCTAYDTTEPNSFGYPVPHPQATVRQGERRVQLHAEVLASDGGRWCRADGPNFHVESAPLPSDLGPGPYELIIRGSDEARWVQARASIHSLVIRGAREAPSRTPAPPEQAAARALVEGDPGLALALLRELGDAPDLARMKFLALDELGRWAQAEAALADLFGGRGQCLADDERKVMFGTFLRHEPEHFGPLLRQLCGEDDYFEILDQVWALSMPIRFDDRLVVPALLTQTAGLERWQPSDPELNRVFLRMVCRRAEARLISSSRGPNITELERATAISQTWARDAPDGFALNSGYSLCNTVLAGELAARGDEDRAFEVLEDAIAQVERPELFADQLSANPMFETLRGHPRWEALVEATRTGRRPGTTG